MENLNYTILKNAFNSFSGSTICHLQLTALSEWICSQNTGAETGCACLKQAGARKYSLLVDAKIT